MLALRLEVKIVNEKFKVASASQARKFLNYCEFYSKVIIHCAEARCSRDGTGRSHRPGLTDSQNEIEILQKISEIQEPAPKVPPPPAGRANVSWPGLVPTLASPYKKMFYVVFYKIQAKNLFLYYMFFDKKFLSFIKNSKGQSNR